MSLRIDAVKLPPPFFAYSQHEHIQPGIVLNKYPEEVCPSSLCWERKAILRPLKHDRYQQVRNLTVSGLGVITFIISQRMAPQVSRRRLRLLVPGLTVAGPSTLF
jgi:hypothetical protein